MHQTFYIEVDEEISSVIDKLHKSPSRENYFVITKRALVFQSIVNLKLLKREAEKLGKQIVLIMTDEQATKMAQRAGIIVQSSMEGLDFAADEKIEEVKVTQLENDAARQKKRRLVEVGSSDYYGSSKEYTSSDDFSDTENSEDEDSEPIIFSPKPMPVVNKPAKVIDDLRKNTSQLGHPYSDGIRKSQSIVRVQKPQISQSSNYDLSHSLESFLDQDKDKRVERIFSSQSQKSIQKENQLPMSRERSGGKNIVFVFAILALFVFAGIAAYIFVPSADVVVYLDVENNKINSSVTADINQSVRDIESLNLSARLVENESELTLTHGATGVSESAGQKARGTLVIYNEYSATPQPLVATTRFETEDGKIFRLVKGVSVPGLSNLGGTRTPGAIEVEVIADMAGDLYNIEPSSFKVAGLKGTDRYDKIYAKSAKPMTGGGLSADAAKIVSQSDIDSAKTKTEEALQAKIEDMIKSELREGERMISQASKIEIIESASSAQEGDLKNSFEYRVKAKLRTFVLMEKDLNDIAINESKSLNKKSFEYAIDKIAVEIESAEADFDSGKATLKMAAQLSAKPIFDSARFKQDLVAKNEEQIREMMSGFPQVKNLEISVEPAFLSTTPKFESRINLEIRDYVGK